MDPSTQAAAAEASGPAAMDATPDEEPAKAPEPELPSVRLNCSDRRRAVESDTLLGVGKRPEKAKKRAIDLCTIDTDVYMELWVSMIVCMIFWCCGRLYVCVRAVAS